MLFRSTVCAYLSQQAKKVMNTSASSDRSTVFVRSVLQFTRRFRSLHHTPGPGRVSSPSFLRDDGRRTLTGLDFTSNTNHTEYDWARFLYRVPCRKSVYTTTYYCVHTFRAWRSGRGGNPTFGPSRAAGSRSSDPLSKKSPLSLTPPGLDRSPSRGPVRVQYTACMYYHSMYILLHTYSTYCVQ